MALNQQTSPCRRLAAWLAINNEEEKIMISRRNLIGGSVILAGAAAVSGRVQAAAIPEAVISTSPAMQPPLVPTSGPAYQPVVTLNGWTLPWRMNGDWKEFHLVAEPVVREFAPGMKAHLWGYNGQAPGPTIEAVEGDKVRIFVTNKLPEHTTIHWHGMLLPNGMDGVGGLTQPHIKPGKTFVYEFELKKSGTFMYHPHSDEMVQMAMGMMGMLVIHPRDPTVHRADRDFVFIMSAYLIDPGTYLPKVSEMTDFNMWTWNSRVFPGIDPMPMRLGDRVRIRMGNLTMTNHPIHLHGHHFSVAGTDGGWVPESAQWPEATIDVPVGAVRAVEFVADSPGDWAFHCHKTHHAMNAMGHNVRNFIGVEKRDLVTQIRKLAPDYHPMGTAGMAEMGAMEMAAPDNTLPMMTGFGQFGPIEMGGMFTVMKIREGLARDDYTDPGPYKHPTGTVAYEVEAPATNDPPHRSDTPDARPGRDNTIRKPAAKGHYQH
jgi:manganese oxidase